MTPRGYFPWLALALALSGCVGTISGLDGQGGFSCKAPDGISCASLSGVYANAVQNSLPGQVRPVEASIGEPPAAMITRPVPRSGEPIRSSPQVRRVWLAPWEDDDEILHDQSYLYFVVDPGRWQIEHTHRQASEAYRPVRPPGASSPAAIDPGQRPALPGREKAAPEGQPFHSLPSLPSFPLPGREPLPPATESE